MMISGFVLAWVMYIYRPAWPGEIAEQHDLIYKFLLNKWYFDEIDFIFVRPAKMAGTPVLEGGDGYVIDGFGPDGIAANVLRVTLPHGRPANRLCLSLCFCHVVGCRRFR